MTAGADAASPDSSLNRVITLPGLSSTDLASRLAQGYSRCWARSSGSLVTKHHCPFSWPGCCPRSPGPPTCSWWQRSPKRGPRRPTSNEVWARPLPCYRCGGRHHGRCDRGGRCLGVRRVSPFACPRPRTPLVVLAFGFDLLTTPGLIRDSFVPSVDTAVTSPMLAGSVVAFFAFVGFENMANMAEETVDPKRTGPVAILIVLGVSHRPLRAPRHGGRRSAGSSLHHRFFGAYGLAVPRGERSRFGSGRSRCLVGDGERHPDPSRDGLASAVRNGQPGSRTVSPRPRPRTTPNPNPGDCLGRRSNDHVDPPLPAGRVGKADEPCHARSLYHGQRCPLRHRST